MSDTKYIASGPARTPIASPAIPGSAMELAVVGFIIVLALYFGQVVLVPLALAVILSFVLAPAVRLLRRWGISNSIAVCFVVACAFAVIFGIGAVIAQQIGSLAQEIPRYQLTLRDKVKSLKDYTSVSGGAFEQASDTLKDLQHELEKRASPTPPGVAVVPQLTLRPPATDGPTVRKIPVEVYAPEPTPFDQLQSIIGIVIAPLATTGLIILFVLFLLMRREDVRDRAIRLVGTHDLEKSTSAMDDAGYRLGRYFLTLTAINAAFGIIIGLGLWMIGVPSPILWGVLAMLMRFVPFIGSIIAAAFPLLLAAAVDPGWSMFLMTLALYLIAEPIMGNVVEPVVQGQSTGLSPLAIILSAAFWTLLWGPIGLLLAIPLTVVLVVLGRHVERLEFLSVLLGDTPPLSPPERFYQRMLAGDPAEAVEQAERMIKERPLIEYYDDVVIEGLRLAQADADREALDAERLPDLRETAAIVIDTLSEYDFLPTKRAKSAPDEASSEPDVEAIDYAKMLDPSAVDPDWRSARAILCIGARTPLDDTAALVLAQLLNKCGLGATVISQSKIKHGALPEEEVEGVRLICVSALDAKERSSYTRFLVRRLKRSAPDARVLGCFWKLDPDERHDKEIVASIAVDAAAYSVKDALEFCLQAASSNLGGSDEDEGDEKVARPPPPSEVLVAS